MIDDPVAVAGLVTREVRSGSRDGAPTKTVVARRTYPTDRVDLWDALTNPERIPRWFLPVSGDLREGGRYQLEGNAGGVVERCDEPESFALTWEFESMVSWVTVTLTPDGVHTLLELTHEGPVDEMWEQYGPAAGGVGWDLALMGLGLHFETDEPMDPAEAMAFTFTPEGIAFVERSAAGWAEAAIGDGEHAGPAREAAGRTVAFYITPPDETAPDESVPDETAPDESTGA